MPAPKPIAAGHPPRGAGHGAPSSSVTPLLLPAPKERWLVPLGFACNNRCVFCAQGELRAEQSPLDPASIRARIDAGRQAGADTLFFVGGEPTVHDGLVDWIAHAHDAGYQSIGVQTNGRRLAYGGYARALAQAGLNAVDISLHGPNAGIHDFHTQVPGSFAQTVRGIQATRPGGLKTAVTHVITRSNFRHLLETVALAWHLRVGVLHLALAQVIGRAASDRMKVAPNLGMVLPFLDQALRSSRKGGMRILTSGAPLCALGTHAGAALEHHQPEGPRPAPGFEHRPACGECPAVGVCPGVTLNRDHTPGVSVIAPVEPRAWASMLTTCKKYRSAAGTLAGLGTVATWEKSP